MITVLRKYKNYIFTIGGFLLGFFASGGLLLYSGKELVNIFIYFTFIVLIPAMLSLFSFFAYFFARSGTKIEALKLSLLGGTLFSLGALISLVLTITTKDIAFGWATTLNIDTMALKSLLDKIAIWKSFCSSCAPSQELIELSRYNRLGSAVNKEQVANALTLGQWWKFLALSIVVYGVLLRGLLLSIATFLSRNFKGKIEFDSATKEESFEQIDNSYANISKLKSLQDRDFRLIGYHYDTSKLALKSNPEAKDIVLAVKSWEPPIMDFFDYLEELKANKISILLIGLNGKARQEDIDIWTRKLNELNLNYEVIV